MATPIPHSESKDGQAPELKISSSSHSSLSSVSQHNVKISPLHSHTSHTSVLTPSTSPKSSPQKLVPISDSLVPRDHTHQQHQLQNIEKEVVLKIRQNIHNLYRLYLQQIQLNRLLKLGMVY